MDQFKLKETRRELTYHEACAAQYRAIAAQLSGALQVKPLEHAKWHDAQAVYLRADLTKGAK